VVDTVLRPAVALELEEHLVAVGGDLVQLRLERALEQLEERPERAVDERLLAVEHPGDDGHADDRPLDVVGDEVEQGPAVTLLPRGERLADEPAVL
jgi:hypothetical protein